MLIMATLLPLQVPIMTRMALLPPPSTISSALQFFVETYGNARLMLCLEMAKTKTGFNCYLLVLIPEVIKAKLNL